LERGNLKEVYHAEKKKPNSIKKLNFDTLECGNCRGYVMCLWSASSSGLLHDCRVLPYPLRITEHPKYWPEDVGRLWIQAHRSLSDENYDAAAVMARSALQSAVRHQHAVGTSLKGQIQDLASRGILPPLMQEWSDQVRILGNDAAHPGPGQAAPDPRDAKDIVQFLDFLLEYLYTLPHRIIEYRRRGQRA